MIMTHFRTACAVLGVVLLAVGCRDVEGANSTSAGQADCGYAYYFEDPIASSTAEQTQERGIQHAEAQLGIRVHVVQGTGLADAADNLRALAAKGCYQAIGTTFFELGAPLIQVAKQYPKQKFFISGGDGSAPNIINYALADEQGTYVAGAMAAKLTRTGVIGVILGDDSPPLERFAIGFTKGARSVNPKIRVLNEAVGSFSDPAGGAAIAATMASQGVDVIYPATGANLQILLGGQAHHYCPIVSDMTEYAQAEAQGAHICYIAAEAADNEVFAIFKQLRDGTGSGDNRLLTMQDGIYTIPYVTGAGETDFTLPASVITAGKAAYASLLAGKVTIPVPTS
jgi:basic membrane protein A